MRLRTLTSPLGNHAGTLHVAVGLSKSVDDSQPVVNQDDILPDARSAQFVAKRRFV